MTTPRSRTPSRPSMTSILRVAALALVATACLGLAPASAIFAPHMDVPPRHSDAIVVLGPATADRLLLAESLVEQGFSDTIVVSVDNVGVEFSKRRIDLCDEDTGVKVICREPSPGTTQGEVGLIENLSAQYGWARVIVITRDTHVTRSRLYLDRCYSGEADVLGTTTDMTLLEANWQYWYQTAGFLKSALVTTGC